MYVGNMNLIYGLLHNMGVMCVQVGCGCLCMWEITNHAADCLSMSIIHSAARLLYNCCFLILFQTRAGISFKVCCIYLSTFNVYSHLNYQYIFITFSSSFN